MVVEDDVHVKVSLLHLLDGAGYEAIDVEDESTTLERARAEAPALIILDLMLPKVSGLEICKQLKLDAATQDIPVIILTARTTTVDKISGLQLGADDYVTKPFNPREMILRIQRSLGF